jgi:hypothetical protein
MSLAIKSEALTSVSYAGASEFYFAPHPQLANTFGSSLH